MNTAGLQPPPPDALSRYAVNLAQGQEVIYEPLYDYVTYVQAGQTSLSFFQEPIGQSSKTESDTNMRSAGQLPQPQRFLITSISIDFFPAALPGRDDITLGTNWNDTKEFFEDGVLKLLIGNKHYTIQGPLGKFPSNYRLDGVAGLTGETAATTATTIEWATVVGRPYNLIPLMIPPNQNFSVRLEWDAVVGITADSRVGVNLNGFTYRSIQ